MFSGRSRKYCKLLIRFQTKSLTRTLSRVEGQLVNSEASIAGFALQVDPEVPGDLHSHLARLPFRAGRVQGPGTQVPQLGRGGQVRSVRSEKIILTEGSLSSSSSLSADPTGFLRESHNNVVYL